MPAKKHKPEEIIGKLREVEIVVGQGGTIAEGCRRIAVSEQTYYRWRKEYGGLNTDQARRMKDLERENLRLRRAISDLTLDKLILQDESVSDPSGGWVVARMHGETSEPRAAPTLYRAGERGAGCIRATGVLRARAASVDAVGRIPAAVCVPPDRFVVVIWYLKVAADATDEPTQQFVIVPFVVGTVVGFAKV